MGQIEEWDEKLAELAVFGANVQPGQLVAVTSYIGKEDAHPRGSPRAAYARGAKYVDVLYFDQWVKRERIAHAADETLDYIPPWMSERLLLPLRRARRADHALRARTPRAPSTGLDPARAGRDLLPYLPRDRRDREPDDDELDASSPRRRTPGRRRSIRSSAARTRTSSSGRPSRTSAGSTRTIRPGVGGAGRGAEGEREPPHRAAVRRDPAPRPRHGPHDRAAALRRTGPRVTLETVDGRRHSPNLPTEELFTTPDPERVDGHVTRHDAARALRLGHLRHPRRVRGRASDQDRRGRRAPTRCARSPRRTTARRGSARSRSSTARGASARSRRSSSTP